MEVVKSKYRITWVIEKYLFEEYDQQLADAAKDEGCRVLFFDDTDGVQFKDFMVKHFTDEDIVIFHGSLQLGRQLTHLPYYPGVFMNIDNYECYKYYGHYGESLLNSEYLMMGLNDVVRNKRLIKSILPNYGFADPHIPRKLFIRPSNGYKSFAGQVISFDNLEEEINTLKQSYGGIDPETLVVISPAQNIIEEFRFAVVDGKVISGALYMDRDNMGTFKPYYNKPCFDQQAINFAKLMAERYQPDKAYTMDICLVDEGDYHLYKLLEINSFNCASMYGMLYSTVVKEINKLAIKEHQDLFEI